MTPFLTVARRNFKVVLICIFLINNYVELFFIYLQTIFISSFEQCLFSKLLRAHLGAEVGIKSLNTSYSLDIILLAEEKLAKFFLPFSTSSLHSLKYFLGIQKLFTQKPSHLLILGTIFSTLGIPRRKLCLCLKAGVLTLSIPIGITWFLV